MGQVRKPETTLPAESNSKPVKERKVKLSEAARSAYGLESEDATLVEKGEVESVVRVGEQTYVVGNEEVEG